ncbi:MAG: hypothetical protein RBS57_16665 [Desulforhabdus sp.]|jgi:hypothetical protein|nr:hypothetical protein [Desulforhabdus sp.]
MNERNLGEKLAAAFIAGWDVTPTGNGYLLSSDWRWPNADRIEIHVRTVGEREDLYLVSDGGDLFSFLYSRGIDLSKDKLALGKIGAAVENYDAKLVDYQIAKGANEEELPRAIRLVLEAIKDASLILWDKFEKGSHLH